MSRRSPDPAKQVEPGAVKATDVLVLHHRDSWPATRFALPPYHLAQMRYPLRHKLMTTPDRSFYRMDGLAEEKRAELFALLGEQSCRFEVWR